MYSDYINNIAYNILFDTEYFVKFFENGIFHISSTFLILLGVRLGASFLRSIIS